MCRSIVERSRSRALLSVPNNEGETPFFSAALHGHKDAFLYLASICNRVEATFTVKGTMVRPYSTVPSLQNTMVSNIFHA